MNRTKSLPQTTEQLPYALYRAAQVREFDRVAIEDFGIPGATLMERAGQAAFQQLQQHWPKARRIAVLCGIGNNGGDGYVVARLAFLAGLEVEVLQLGDTAKFSGDALQMATAYRSLGGAVRPFQRLSEQTDLIVDAVFGTGLEREVVGAWAEALQQVNQHHASVLALDIPSGLAADTGQQLGVAVRAAMTVTFIALKQGLFTGFGPDACGQIVFASLGVPAKIYQNQLLAARRNDWRKQSSLLSPRPRTAHKGHFGHLLVIGGAPGFSGAVRLAAEAGARCGAGLVSVATWPDHAAVLNLHTPELMVHRIDQSEALQALLQQASVVAIGPGLGRTAFAQKLLRQVLATDLPLVVDADALNLLAEQPMRRGNWVLTPHPGEAGRLLDCSTAAIQQDRFAAAKQLQHRFGGIVVLKGAGTLIQGEASPVLCSDGNPGMASGGMGDVLTGMIAAWIAQGLDLEEAAVMGVSLHAAAADQAAKQGERGLLASDLFAEIRSLINPQKVSS